jgi:hypothetical protein
MRADTFQSVTADYETGERRIRLEMQFKLMWRSALRQPPHAPQLGAQR